MRYGVPKRGYVECVECYSFSGDHEGKRCTRCWLMKKKADALSKGWISQYHMIAQMIRGEEARRVSAGALNRK